MHSCLVQNLKPRSEGGVGIIKKDDVNATFIAKQGWKILTQLDNIWVRIVKAKYLKNNVDMFL